MSLLPALARARLFWKGKGRVLSAIVLPEDGIDCPFAFLAAIVNGVRALSVWLDTLDLAIVFAPVA